ncbi:MAG: glycosyltransferase [Candidatus Omnitrophota bacterium]|nr:glycosyltransferase [Candidatus Omnitrophota bacterium]
MMKVTVLMTVYNGGRFLRQAVESVLAQSYSDFEFLIVDDASSDGSLEIIKAYQDPRIRIIQNSLNKGQTASLNIGLREARGEFIARIDADDIALPRWLEYQTRVARNGPENAVISSRVGVINENGFVKQLLDIPQTHEGMVLRSLTASPVNHGGSLIKREVILQYGGYDESFRILADYDLWIRLLHGGVRFSSGKDVLMAVRFHEGSISKAEKNRAVAEETKKVFRRNIAFLTHRELLDRDLMLLWELCYGVDTMLFQDMEEAVILLRTIYGGLSLENIGSVGIMRHWQERVKVFFAKKIFTCLSAGDRLGVLEACRRYEQHCGRSFMTALFRCLSFLGSFGKMTPRLFNFRRRLGAVLALRYVHL